MKKMLDKIKGTKVGIAVAVASYIVGVACMYVGVKNIAEGVYLDMRAKEKKRRTLIKVRKIYKSYSEKKKVPSCW